MPEINFQDSSIKYHYYSWQEIGDITYDLSRKILKDDLKIDRIVALATGGLTMSRALRDYLGVKNLSNIQIQFYQDIAKKSKMPVVSQSLPVNIDGENILVFDDINDSGGSLDAAKKYLVLRGAKSITTATLFQKQITKTPSDYFEIESDCWVIFPDEKRESIESLSKNWSQQGIEKEEIISRLKKIGFKTQHIKDFCSLC